MRRRPGALFAPGLSLWIFSRDILFRLYRKVSYPSFTPHQAQGTYAIRQESEKRAGEYRENGAREDRDPLHSASVLNILIQSCYNEERVLLPCVRVPTP
jgi:hypothetical protein